MKAEIKTITPEIASELLGKNQNNRAINRQHVEFLSREMKAGRWKLNGDTICLNGERLIDGQHRLAACVMSGVTFQSFVIEGLDSDVFDTKDIGKRRSGGDTLSAMGEHNAYRLAAALVIVDKYMTGRSDKSVAYTNAEMKLLLDKYPDLRGSLISVSKKSFIQPSIVDALYYLFAKKDPAAASGFFEKLITGKNLSDEEPVYLLRERLIRNSLEKAKLSKPYIVAICIKAWNFTRQGKRIRNLRFREAGDAAEQFPVIY